MVLIGASLPISTWATKGSAPPSPATWRRCFRLLAAALALAARGAGRRWGPAVGAVIVVLFLAHDIFSQLLVLGRYYG